MQVTGVSFGTHQKLICMKKIYVFILLVIIASATNAQTLTEVLVPQYIQGLNGTNATRVPFAYRLTLSGLAASTTYRYINSMEQQSCRYNIYCSYRFEW